MKKSLLFISAASLLLAGCAKEQLVKEQHNNGAVTVVKATFEQLSNGATKAAVTDAGVFTWQNGDKAAFAESNASASYCSGENGANGANATFAIDGSHTFTSDSWAVYPYDLASGQTPAALKVTVPASRVWATGQTNVAMYGVKDASAARFNFSHMGGLVRIRVNNVPTNAREFVFKAGGCKINGEFAVNTVSEYKVIETVASDNESEQTYTLTWADAPAAENTMDFFIPLPVGTYGGGFAFYLKDGEHNVLYSKVGSTSQTIARKKLLLMPAITLMGGAFEPTEVVIPAGYSEGDYILPKGENVILKIDASGSNNDITLKYDGDSHLPANLEIQVIGGTFDKKVSGDLPYTHVDYIEGDIANVEITTSASTFNIVHPATISEKLIVTGGNVVLKGATVQAIEVAESATADGENPVRIELKIFTPEGGTEQTPAVTDKIVAKADIVVASEEGVSVTVNAEGDAKIETEGEGEVIDDSNKVAPLPGVFSVSATKKVQFSQGNLTYNVTDKKWAFYENQYDCATGYDSNLISLFTWGYNAEKSIVPNGNNSDNVSRTSGNLTQDEDWGCTIGDGKSWRTLTIDEWCYLFAFDENQYDEPCFYITTSPRYGLFRSCVTVCGHNNCIVLLPDDWKWGGTVGEKWQTTYSEETSVKWSAMEAAGAVCLPAAGTRNLGNSLNYVGETGNYWSSTTPEAGNANNLYFDNTLPEDYLFLSGQSQRQIGHSVRLVTDVPAK